MQIKKNFLNYLTFKSEEEKLLDKNERRNLNLSVLLICLTIVVLNVVLFSFEILELKVLIIFVELLSLVLLYDRFIICFLGMRRGKKRNAKNINGDIPVSDGNVSKCSKTRNNLL